VDYLSASIQWEEGVWHEILLSYNANFTALYLDGALVAQGSGVSVVPEAAARSQGFALGGDLGGANLAQGEFDELTTYRRPIVGLEVDWAYRLRASIAPLGPVTLQEEQAARNARTSRISRQNKITRRSPKPVTAYPHVDNALGNTPLLNHL
jgi:hypothetical protein